jgi:hypothetical protein
MTDNPYSPPRAPVPRADREAWPAKIFPPFFSSAIAITLGLLFLGVQHRAPGFFTSTRFLLALVGCSAASALLLLPYSGATWLARTALATLIGLGLFFLLSAGPHLFAA